MKDFDFKSLGRKRYIYIFSITTIENGENIIATCNGAGDAQKFYDSLATEIKAAVSVTTYRGIGKSTGKEIPNYFAEIFKAAKSKTYED